MAATADPSATPQHRRAMRRANHVRLARAELRRAVREGEVLAADVVADPPVCAANATIRDVLMWQTRWGRQRALSLLRRVPVSESKTLAALTDRQRAVIVQLLGERA